MNDKKKKKIIYNGWEKEIASGNLTFIHGSYLFNDVGFFYVDNWSHERGR